jgi:hypothetical protein
LDSADLNQRKKLSYVYIDQNQVQDRIKKERADSQIPTFDIDNGDEEKLFQCIDSYVKSI